MKKFIVIALIGMLATPVLMAQNGVNKIQMYDKNGKLILKKEGLKLNNEYLYFNHLMTVSQFDTLTPGTYFYLLEKNGEKQSGYLKKKRGGFSLAKLSGIRENLLKGRLFLQIDGKKIPFKGDTTINGINIELKKHRFKLEGNMNYAQEISLWCGDKEYPVKKSDFHFDYLDIGSSSFRKGGSFSGFIYLCRNRMNEDLYLNLDGKKIHLKDGLSIGESKIYLKKKGIRVKGTLKYKKEFSILCNEEEIWYMSPHWRPAWSIQVTPKEDTKEYAFLHKSRYAHRRKKIVLKAKNNQSILLVVDGKEYLNKDGFKEIAPDSIQEIQVLRKGATATALFGERGKNGVVFIKTKPYNE